MVGMGRYLPIHAGHVCDGNVTCRANRVEISFQISHWPRFTNDQLVQSAAIINTEPRLTVFPPDDGDWRPPWAGSFLDDAVFDHVLHAFSDHKLLNMISSIRR